MAQPERDDDNSTDRNPRVAFVIPQADLERLEKVAADRRQSVSSIVRGIVCTELDRLFADA